MLRRLSLSLCLVVLCTPVGTLPGLVRAIWPALPAGALLTDVGSVKRGVVEAAEACPPRSGVAFVGGHPMAGSERSGYAAAAADLFEGRPAGNWRPRADPVAFCAPERPSPLSKRPRAHRCLLLGPVLYRHETALEGVLYEVDGLGAV